MIDRPRNKFSEGFAPVAVTGFFFRRQLGESFLKLGKIKQGIVSKAIRAAWAIQDNAFCLSAKCSQGFPIAGGCDYTYETSSPIFGRRISPLGRFDPPSPGYSESLREQAAWQAERRG